ncbi:hypothetical protein PPUJ20028_42580 [Pseudomonas putida]|nr:hypothetical protein PPUJ20028_42580 [Pseudomonas putida]
MLGITRIHRYLRPLPANRTAASGRDLKAKRAARLTSQIANLLCTPRSAPPYLCVAPERAPDKRVPPT